MNPETTLSMAAGSGTASLSLLVIVNWLLGLHGITVPPDVQQAAGTILTVVIHWLFTLEFRAKELFDKTHPQKPGA